MSIESDNKTRFAEIQEKIRTRAGYSSYADQKAREKLTGLVKHLFPVEKLNNMELVVNSNYLKLAIEYLFIPLAEFFQAEEKISPLQTLAQVLEIIVTATKSREEWFKNGCKNFAEILSWIPKARGLSEITQILGVIVAAEQTKPEWLRNGFKAFAIILSWVHISEEQSTVAKVSSERFAFIEFV